MEYRTEPTERGNIGVSCVSLAWAEAQAKAMDDGGCTGCMDCTDCTDCTGCTSCEDCTNCEDCMNCTDCTDCYDCTDCTSCEDCMDCELCVDCKDCHRCTECVAVSDSQNIHRWDGGPTKNLVGLYGMRWDVATDGIRIQIGCKNYSAEEWEAFSDNKVKAMDYGALEFWRIYKDIILSLARLRRPHGTRKENDNGISNKTN